MVLLTVIAYTDTHVLSITVYSGINFFFDTLITNENVMLICYRPVGIINFFVNNSNTSTHHQTLCLIANLWSIFFSDKLNLSLRSCQKNLTKQKRGRSKKKGTTQQKDNN